MGLSGTRLTYKGAVKSAAARTCELYTSASDWAGAQTLKMVNAAGTTLYVGLDPANVIKHRDMLPSGASDPLILKCSPGFDNVFPNGNFASALSGWTAYSPLGMGFDITRVTDFQMLYPPASGLLTKAKTKQTGAYVECNFTIAAADRSSRLYAQVSTKVLEDYVDGLFKVQVLAAGKLMAEKDIPNYHTTLQLEWTGNATATYTLRFKVNSDNDDNKTLDKVRKVVIGNIYAGPKLNYTIARKALVVLNDQSEVLADRVLVPDIDIDEDGYPMQDWDNNVIYEKILNFDYDAVLSTTGTKAYANLYIDAYIWSILHQGIYLLAIDGVLQTGGNPYVRRLSGRHTVKLTSILATFVELEFQAMLQTEVG